MLEEINGCLSKKGLFFLFKSGYKEGVLLILLEGVVHMAGVVIRIWRIYTARG